MLFKQSITLRRLVLTSFTSVLLVTAPAWASVPLSETFDEESGRLLEERIDYWYGRGRPDRVGDYVEQLLRVHPNHPSLLEAQALLAFNESDLDEASRYYALLVETAPRSSQTLRIEELVTLSEDQQLAISDARLLSLAGRLEESLAKWHEVFPTGPQALNLAIEYWQLVAANGEPNEALVALNRLAQEHPLFIPLQLAIVRTEIALDRYQVTARDDLIDLISDTVFGTEAFSLARSIAVNAPENAQTLAYIEKLLKARPGHKELLELVARIQPQVERQQQLEASGAFDRLQKGLAALERGDALVAEAWLREAWQAGGETAQIAGNLGYAIRQQGRHAEALSWFKRAQALAPDTQEWAAMVASSIFWRDTQVFYQRLEEARLHSAAIALSRLKSHPEGALQQSLLTLMEGELRLARGETAGAIPYFERALSQADTREQAAWALFGIYRDEQRTYAMESFYGQLAPDLQTMLSDAYNGYRASQLVAQADRLMASGEEQQAFELLLDAYSLDPENPWLIADIASYEVDQGSAEQGLAWFERLLRTSPSNDAWYAYALLLARLDKNQEALNALAQLPAEAQTEGVLELQKRVQQAQLETAFTEDWRAVLAEQPTVFNSLADDARLRLLAIMAEEATADDDAYLFLFEQQIQQTPDNSEAYRLASDFAAAIGQLDRSYTWSLKAIELQRSASEAAGLSVWQVSEQDDWRISGLRRQAYQVAERSESVFTIGFDKSHKSGTPGITELAKQTLMLHLKVPFAEREGYWFVQADPTTIDAGEADFDNTFWRDRFGTGLFCEPDCPTGLQETNDDAGIAVGIGADFPRWWFDIGRSPIGFERSEWVGSVGYRFDVGNFGANVKLDRRVLTSTKISFAGQQDPFSEYAWGPAVRHGLGLSLSWDQGERFGWWASLGGDYYDGHNMASNTGWYTFSGAYVRAYDTEPLAVTIGLTGLLWGYQKDLSGVSLGHGNYYSPKTYGSLSVPVSVYGRLNRFSYLLRASVGYSKSKLNSQVFYPQHPDLQEQALQLGTVTGLVPTYEGGTGGGASHSFVGNFEYRLSSHWYVGLALNLIRSDTFSPNQGLLYLRYHFGGYSLPVARPPAPPTAYMSR
ncbi:hypothetical protein CWE15_03645 [Aliidiomarina taiwanensis]|uniref:Cellulose synthase operon C C-terminal domain-containing protein n=1 Tax=Aliidiomarina taiwanensis TaxID=946228 RepID=A0A432XAB8_9GAMM|nr:cellulose synthase subunit BcsC-related outer membrane protein [Aliidiomarina taiwanensis]RUO44274.1 hypothetical protein CWE15_03645 [Aliidiomarina taiwanensis]